MPREKHYFNMKLQTLLPVKLPVCCDIAVHPVKIGDGGETDDEGSLFRDFAACAKAPLHWGACIDE